MKIFDYNKTALSRRSMRYLSNGIIAKSVWTSVDMIIPYLRKLPSGLDIGKLSGDFGIDLYVFLKRKEAAW